MEEDIKILEEILKISKTINYAMETKDLKAIENLLKRYKELEEENKKLSKDYYDLGSNFCDLDEKCKNSIPISVIQNKKKYWEQEHYIAGEHLVVQVLDEILEERNK